MNRSNIGNIFTNAIQTLSVSGFTAGSLRRQLGRADQTLNNMTEEQTAAYRQMQAEKKIAQTKRWNEKAETPLQHLSMEEQTEITKQKAEDLKKKYLNREEPEDVDKIMSNMPQIEENSEQAKEINKKIFNQTSYLKKRREKTKSQQITNIPEPISKYASIEPQKI